MKDEVFLIKFMKKLFNILYTYFKLKNNNSLNVISNEILDIEKINQATKIIKDLHSQVQNFTSKGFGPFIAAIYDANGNLIAKAANTVVNENCSNNHAEINAIKKAQEKLSTYDLSSFNLSIYITAEPCMMCIGAIMWSGIKNVYYSVPSKIVEKITGFDEGFKPFWINEFKKRNIIVYGNIESKLGEIELKKYVNSGKTIYKPSKIIRMQ